MTIQQIREALQDRNLLMVSQRTGVPYSTLRRFANGKVQNPSYKTIEALKGYLNNGVN